MPKQILLVDDSVTIQRVVELTFAHETDYKVTAARSVDEGLQKARDLKPDIVLADAGLGSKSGYDLCASLRSDSALASVPVLILTGNFAPYDEARGSKAGADGYVVKPFESQALIDKVADAINKKGARPAAVASMPPIVATSVGRKDESLEISIEGGKSVPTPVPATRPAAPPPAPAPPPPVVVKPATAAPTARTMMGIPAPTLTPPAAVPPPPKPMAPVAAPPAPVPPPPAPMPAAAPTHAPSPVVAARPAPAAASGMPHAMPQMPRAPMIPGVPTPSAPIRIADAPKPPPPRATLMGIPTVNAGNLPPGTVALPPSMAKPAAPWAPPTPGAHAPAPSAPPPHAPAPHAPPPHAPAHAPMVSAVAERAVADLSARGPEYEAIAQMSREVIERIAWEIVPELAETIIREQLDRLVAERQK
jgi:CheY-like chemotaxis protein